MGWSGILQINSYGFSLAPWTFSLIRSKIVIIKRRSPLSNKESGKLRNGRVRETGEGSRTLPFFAITSTRTTPPEGEDQHFATTALKRPSPRRKQHAEIFGEGVDAI